MRNPDAHRRFTSGASAVPTARRRFPASPLIGLVLFAAALLPSAFAQGATLTVWHYFSVDSQVKVLTDLAAVFHEAQPDVQVDFVFVPYDQLVSKLISSAVAGTGPDIVLYNGPSMGELVASQAIRDMTPYWESFADSAQFAEGTVHRIDDRVYGVQGYVNLLGLWYNADILDEIGVAPPTTIDELNAALTSAVAAGYKGITLTGKANDQGEWQAYPWLSANGWTYADPQPAACEAAFALVDAWLTSKALSPIVATWEQAEPFQAFLVGDVAFTENGNWQLGGAKASAAFEYGVVPMPAGPEAAKVYLGGEVISIGSFSADPDLAWEFLASTYFSRVGQLITVADVGSIPARADAASDPSVTEDAILQAFAQTAQNNGAVYPPEVASVEKVRNAQLVVGQAWSAVIAGQQDPASACREALTNVTRELAD